MDIAQQTLFEQILQRTEMQQCSSSLVTAQTTAQGERHTFVLDLQQQLKS